VLFLIFNNNLKITIEKEVGFVKQKSAPESEALFNYVKIDFAFCI
jgi:hypothetical protein